MRRSFSRPDKTVKHERIKLPFYCWLLMAIGFITVLYFMITYVLIPVLAMLTVS